LRKSLFVPLLLLAACGDGAADEAAKQKAAAAEAAKKLQLAAGQWEATTEVTRFTKQDQAPKAAINAPVGTKSTVSQCISPEQTKEPPAVLLAGSDAYKCTYDNSYISGGTLNASIACKRAGLSGEVRMSIAGTYTADAIEAEQDLQTSLPGPGDANIISKLTARRTGDCTAAPSKSG
jgi:predicted membrane-bound mannosyltransferase